MDFENEVECCLGGVSRDRSFTFQLAGHEGTRHNFSNKLNRFLIREGGEFGDITFIVGPDKVIVRAFKLPLLLVSESFVELFRTTWSDRKFHGPACTIDLPQFDPESFKIFLQLMNYDEIPVSWIKSMNLPMELLFGVIRICQEFNVSVHSKALERLVDDYVENFPSLVHSEEFLDLPQYVLQECFRNSNLPMSELSVFHSALRWAKHKCCELDMEPTGESMRAVLGDVLYQIRFPLIPMTELTLWVCPTGILTEKEQLELLIFKGLPPSVRSMGGASSKVPFSCMQRSEKYMDFTFSVNFLDHFTIRNDPPFCCSEKTKTLYFTTSTKISVFGVGFLGPIHADAAYSVKIQLFTTSKRYAPIQECVMAKKQQTFYVSFAIPVPVEPAETAVGQYKFGLKYVLKGPPTLSSDVVDARECTRFEVQSRNVTFKCDWEDNQLTELLYQLVD